MIPCVALIAVVVAVSVRTFRRTANAMMESAMLTSVSDCEVAEADGEPKPLLRVSGSCRNSQHRSKRNSCPARAHIALTNADMSTNRHDANLRLRTNSSGVALECHLAAGTRAGCSRDGPGTKPKGRRAAATQDSTPKSRALANRASCYH
jgi:hypothetical protein